MPDCLRNCEDVGVYPPILASPVKNFSCCPEMILPFSVFARFRRLTKTYRYFFHLEYRHSVLASKERQAFRAEFTLALQMCYKIRIFPRNKIIREKADLLTH